MLTNRQLEHIRDRNPGSTMCILESGRQIATELLKSRAEIKRLSRERDEILKEGIRQSDWKAAAEARAKIFTDRAAELERVLRWVIDEFDAAAGQVDYAVPRAKALEQVAAARNALHLLNGGAA